jgi:hypothetical protein
MADDDIPDGYKRCSRCGHVAPRHGTMPMARRHAREGTLRSCQPCRLAWNAYCRLGEARRREARRVS